MSVTKFIAVSIKACAALLLCCANIGIVKATVPTFSAIVSPNSVGPGSTSKLIFTITNVDATPITNLDFTNTLPAGLVHATTSGITTNCSNGSVTAADGGTVLTFSNYDLAGSSSCTVSVDVVASTTAGTYTILSGDLTSDEGNSGTATDDLNVVTTLPGYTMSLSPLSINQGAISTLTQTFDNTQNATNYGNLDSTVALGAGLVVADEPNVSHNCGEASVVVAITASAGANEVVLNADGNSFFAGFRSLPAGTSCSLSVDVKAVGIGSLTAIETSALADFTDMGGAKATLTSTQAFALMAFEDNPSTPGSATNLDITLTNFDRGNSATNITFTDDLDAALTGLVATGLPLTDVCGVGSSVTTSDGGASFTFAGGSLAPEASCNFDIPVSIPVGASSTSTTNTTSNFSFDLGGSATSRPAVSHNLTISQAPTISITGITPDPVAAGNDVTVAFRITNIDTINAASDIAFVADVTSFTGGFPVSVTLPAAGFCGGGATMALNVIDTDVHGISMTGGSLAADSFCDFTVDVTMPSDSAPGIYTLATDPISATIQAATVTGGTTSDTVTVLAAPSLQIGFDNTNVLPGATLTATFELTHSASADSDATNTGFSVDLDGALTGMTVTSFSNNSCSTTPSGDGTGTINLAGTTLSAGSTCSFDALLQLPAGGSSATVTVTSSTISADIGGTTYTGAANSNDFNIVTLSASAVPSSTNIEPGSTTDTLDFTLTNNSASDQTGIFFTLNLSSSISSLAATGLPANDVCGGGSSLTGTTTIILTGGNLLAGTSCNFSVTLNVPGGTADNVYGFISSSISFTENAAGFVIDPMSGSFNIVTDESPFVTSLTSTASPLTGISPIPFSVEFSEDIEGFLASDITVTNGSASNLQTVTNSQFTFDVTPSGDPVTVDVQLLAGVVEEFGVGTQVNTASSVTSLDYDTSALPNAVITVPSGIQTNSGSVDVSVTYSNATIIDLTNSKVNLLFTGTASTANFVDNDTANPDITVLNGTTATPTIRVSNLTGDGTMAIGIDPLSARNAVGNVQPINDSTETVSIDNTAPTVAITSAVADPTNAAFTIDIDFTDPATSGLDSSITGFTSGDIILNNANISGFSGTGSSYSATISPIANGNVTVDINANVAQDDHGNGNVAATQFSVTYDISAPTGYAVVIDTPQSFINASNDTAFQFSYSGAEIGSQYSYTITDGASTSAPVTGTITTASGSFTGIDVSSFNEGTLTLSFTLTDIAGNTGVASTDTIIKQYNDAPVITEGASIGVSMSEDGIPNAFSLTLNATDAENETITWSISSNASNGTATVSGTGNSKAVDYVPTADFNGSDSFTVEITDSNALEPLTDSIVVNVTVDPENDAPSFNSTAVIAAIEDSVYVYNISAADIDVGDTLAITATALPGWLSLADNGDGTATLSGTPLNDDVGNNSVTLQVLDDSGAANNTDTQSFTITVVNTNDDPTIDSTAVTTATEDSSYTYNIVTSDVDVGDTRTISASTLPGWLAVTDNGDGTATLTGTPLNADVGSNSVTLVVTDLAGATDTQNFAISVTNTNDAPTFSTASVNAAAEDSVYTYNIVTNDVDVGDTLAITATTIPGWLNLIDNGNGTATLAGTPLNDDVGNNAVTLQVLDNSGEANNSAVQSFTIVVANTNDAPTIDSTAITIATEDSPYTYSVVTSDVDVGDTRTISASTLPAWLTVTDNGDGTALLAGTPLNENVGSNPVTLVVTDRDSATGTQSFNISVTNSNDLPTGLPQITGNLLRTETLTADTSSISDDDGLGPFSYQWRRSGINIAGGNAVNYLLVEDDIGQTISVVVNYTDLRGTSESVTSLETAAISDLDSDGDGIPDLEEGTGDSDGDGIPDYLDEDSDNDGILDADEGNGDSDNDGIPNYLDTSLDEDGDGIPDVLDGDATTDTDGDGIADVFDTDSDNDGISDFDESGASGNDSDGDGIDDAFDVDSTGGTDANNDGVDDAVAVTDSDGDGVPNYLDRDSDNDSVPDVLENNVGTLLQVSNKTSSRVMGLADTDGDGIDNYIDPDSDEDGIGDLAEAATNPVDSDLDQIIDEFDVDFTGGVDANLDGVDDAATLLNSDTDATPDMFDLESDNDGIYDVIEAGLNDTDFDALVDSPLEMTNSPRDTDSDGIPDYRDLDSDNDGNFDIETSGAASLDIDGDGQIDDASQDADNDGIVDAMDDEPNQFGAARDRDGDGVPSSVDADDDGDGISDIVEGSIDSDGDGLINSLDSDSDNDGLSDSFESDRPSLSTSDIDRDGISDSVDIDFTGGIDANGDGVDDSFAIADTDGDGIPDFLDSDSDNDGISDTEEQLAVSLSGLDSDMDGLDDAVDVNATFGGDSNNDGQDDATISSLDIDGDGILAFRDTDTDGDGISDINENGDANFDGINDRLQPAVEVKAISGGGAMFWLIMVSMFMVFIRKLKIFKGAVLCIALLFSFSSHAEEVCDFSKGSCWYSGLSVGLAQFEPVTTNTTWSVTENTDVAVGVLVGVNFNQRVFGEFGYKRLGRASLSNKGFGPQSDEIHYYATHASFGLNLMTKKDVYNLHVKAGLSALESFSDFIPEDTENLTTYGLGIDIFGDNRSALRFSYEKFGDDIENLSVGFIRYF